MLKPGDIIGNRYEILQLLGSGGMAYVYKAKCHKLNRFVAIKVLKPEYSNDAVFLQKFQVEAQAAAALTHQNIVSVYDVGESDGLFYIVMEFVDGITLKQHIMERGRLFPKEAVDIANQIAFGIQAAHGRHTIHRDIKPQNILVGRNGIVKVTDFGIARAASANTITSTDVVGSVHYISPEQARGGYSDERSDIYSLGVTMYEMVTGRVPFGGDNNVTIALAHIQKEAIPVTSYYEDIPKSLEKIIAKAMQKKPERRYQTIQELILDLKRVFTEPNGDYVQMTPVFNDSPTIMMSEEERNKIKAGVQKEEQLEVFPVDSHVEQKEAVPDKKEEPPKKEAQKMVQNIEEEEPYEEDDYEEEYEEEQGKRFLGRKFSKRRDYEEEEDEEEELEGADEESGMDPKLEKLVFVLGIAAAVLVALFVVFMIGKALNLFGSDGGKQPSITTESTISSETTTEDEVVSMIKIVGMDAKEAQSRLADLGLSFGKLEYEKSDEYDKDQIIKQSVAEGEEVTVGTQIDIVISEGAEATTEVTTEATTEEDLTEVPDFYGDTKSDAEYEAKQYGIKIIFKSAYSTEQDKGCVFEQSIPANTEVKKGTVVTVTLSLGAEETKPKVPDFTGGSVSNAQSLANSLGLVLNVKEQYNSEVSEGTVYDQATPEGTEVEKGTIITIYVSKGSEPVTVYQGSITLSQGANPFTEGENESGYVKVIADQDGEEKVIFEGTLTYKDFPKTITFTSYSNKSAHIYMLVDGEQVPGDWVVAME